ncbi:hypothetical protein GXM_04920 [Nostoc sphaeroides CCNUC1]|uniref:Uncharacterized protein n=1 Tax=Nostoc sphaeroides CCNUC1 TaxID=2653204 RepID=A0A5P8W3W3_9NOSO|nr:hypothetical protein GXM_04920 [Nostoc sphaeroides CCNUC1]
MYRRDSSRLPTPNCTDAINRVSPHSPKNYGIKESLAKCQNWD